MRGGGWLGLGGVCVCTSAREAGSLECFCREPVKRQNHVFSLPSGDQKELGETAHRTSDVHRSVLCGFDNADGNILRAAVQQSFQDVALASDAQSHGALGSDDPPMS